MSNQTDILKVLGKIFSYKTEADEIIKPENYEMFVDAAHIMLIIPKTQELLTYIVNTFDVQGKPLDGTMRGLINGNGKKGWTNDKNTFTSKVSSEYLTLLIQLCKNSTSVQITVGEDFPLKFETSRFIVLIAPRID